MQWEAFFNDNGVEYVTRGPNTKKGNISIKCPWCGDDDPSHHMGVSINSTNYGCWRGAGHSGKNPARLIAAILGCSFTQARLIAEQYSRPDPSTLDEAILALQGGDKPRQARSATQLALPPGFRPIKATGTGRRFWQYLEDRDFTHIEKLVEWYDLRYTTTGRWKDRIIFPIKEGGQVVTWTGRAIGVTIEAARYLSLSEDEEYEPPALKNIKHTIFNYDEVAQGGEVLLAVEGPFDAIKLDYYGQQLDVRTTCVFGTKMHPEQASILGEVGRRYKRRILLYDANATEELFAASDLLTPFDFQTEFMPDWAEDPGAMKPKQAIQYLETFL